MLRSKEQDAEAAKLELEGLRQLFLAYAPHDGFFELKIPGVWLIRASRPSKELVHGLHRTSMCLVLQGTKRILLGSDIYDYDPSQILVSTVDVPISAQVQHASASEPFLSVAVGLDAQRIEAQVSKVFPQGPPVKDPARALFLCPVDLGILSATRKLLDLVDRPDEIELLAPLILDEIVIRLLRSGVGPRLAQIGQEKSHTRNIANAVSWVQANFDQPLDVERLANSVHMSLSSFHRHFKAITTMSPLQYQKTLRLQEARRLMLTKKMDAGTACRQVGYLSSSQFSREYSRYFGNAPTRDIALLQKGQ